MSFCRKGAKNAKDYKNFLLKPESFSLRPLRLCDKNYYFAITRAISSTLHE